MKAAGDKLKETLPSRASLLPLMLEALAELGGEASVSSLDDAILAKLSLTPEQLAVPRSGSRTEMKYRLAWVRSSAKQKGWIIESGPRRWRLVDTAGTLPQ